MDFEKELEKLLALETEPLPGDALAALVASELQTLAALQKKQTDISLQVEEIHDILQEKGEASEKVSEPILFISAAISLSDMIEDFYAFAAQSQDADLERQAAIMLRNADAVLGGCGIARIGRTGERFNPSLHTVQTITASTLPREHITQVLSSGYTYSNSLLRKAVVVVSG
ncbi:MAG: nucleotide exchange factor GrpE [Clostridiales bacterium]|jgi:molecular chaperone GrpE (heat shock protein)|nr:nucleotide exchange factor GrpE [Clostridiales bacterium]